MTATANRDGGCVCGAIRYRVHGTPLIVHACHCTWCQNLSGSAFALNAMIETSRVELLKGSPEAVETPTQSGAGQTVMRCPVCRTSVWTHYGQSGMNIAFVRVGTLDDTGAMPPDIHIYTDSKRPWVVIEEGVASVPGWYNPREVWSSDAMRRYQEARR